MGKLSGRLMEKILENVGEGTEVEKSTERRGKKSGQQKYIIGIRKKHQLLREKTQLYASCIIVQDLIELNKFF